MGRCRGLHCDGCRHGGGGAAGIGALVLLLGVLLLAAHGRAIRHIASDALHVAVGVAMVAALAGAVTAGCVWLRRRAVRRAVDRRQVARSVQAWVIPSDVRVPRAGVESGQHRDVLRALPDASAQPQITYPSKRREQSR